MFQQLPLLFVFVHMIAVAAGGLQQTQETTCPAGWTAFDNACYYFPVVELLYGGCKDFCALQGINSKMLCIENNFQDAFISSQAKGWTHIDITDVTQEGTWVWGPGCSANYTHWREFEPGGGTSENYATLATDGGWEDVDNQHTYFCACQSTSVASVTPPTIAPTTAPTTAPATTPSPACPEGWKSFQDKCYLIPEETMIYADCQAFCPAQRADATMLCIENAAEEAFLAQNVIGWTNIGYTDLANEGDFVWGPGCLSTYHHWRDGTPGGGYGVNCATMLDAAGWLNTDCPVWKYYCACEIDTNPALAVLVPTTAPSRTPNGCPDGWRRFEGKCYFTPDVALVYEDCKAFCPAQAADATMLCVENAAEEAYLAKSVRGWTNIDFTDLAQEGTFKWGGGCNSTYVHWRDGVPGGDATQNCATMLDAQGWLNTDCPVWKYYCACETPVPAPVIPPPPACPEGWKSFQDKCYLIPDETMIYADCQAYCPAQRADATMLCIENAAEEAFLAQNVIGWTNIGYTDLATEGDFVWGSGCLSTYHHWRDGVPGGDATQNCATMLDAQGWLNTDCPVWKYYCACEVPLVPQVPNLAPTPEPSRRTIYLTRRPISDPALAPTVEPTSDAPQHLFDVVQDVDGVDYDIYLAKQELYDLAFQETILLAMGDLPGLAVFDLVVSAGQRRLQQLRHEDASVLATAGVHLQYGVYSVGGTQQQADVVAAALVSAVQTGAFDELLQAQGAEAGVSGLAGASSRNIETKDPPATVEGGGTANGSGSAWESTTFLAIIFGLGGMVFALAVAYFMFFMSHRTQTAVMPADAAKYSPGAASTDEQMPHKEGLEMSQIYGASSSENGALNIYTEAGNADL